MKCPTCNYEDMTMTYTDNGYIEGSEGNFYMLPIKMERDSNWPPFIERASVFGCPKCSTIFMDI